MGEESASCKQRRANEEEQTVQTSNASVTKKMVDKEKIINVMTPGGRLPLYF